VLTTRQQDALAAVRQALDRARFARLLLHGVTGSGKTEVYLRAIEHALGLGRSAICLVPEIALTPQTIDRFVVRFGDQVAVWHSRVSARQRAQEWARLSSGDWRIVVGARSAVFAPVRRLGLVILDEEHEPTYKQEDVPRYHARETACARARLTGAAVVLGSATPSIESYYAAGRRGGRLLALPERIRGRGLPAVEVVDMRRQRGRPRGGSPLSGRLVQALEEAAGRGEQAMLLLNRRGFARVSQCRACGFTERCPRCSVPLVYHTSPARSSAANGGAGRQMVCHYCNFSKPPQETCPECRKDSLRLRGAGTERVESELHRLFPAAAIGRMDLDTTRHRQGHRALYEAVKAGRITLLVGTQMIAKGFDFPRVTLVGVVSADTALNLPDFRAGERTFDLLTQVAGRAGRGERPGRVILQTYCPSHYAIQAATTHDYQAFYAAELAMRRGLRLPPFAHLIELIVLGSSRERAGAAAERLAARLRRASGGRFALLGPAPHRIPRLRRTHRMALLLSARSVEAATSVLRTVLQEGRKFEGLPVLVDVDPL
jgi:primosomal protein N' (replication factor Y)